MARFQATSEGFQSLAASTEASQALHATISYKAYFTWQDYGLYAFAAAAHIVFCNLHALPRHVAEDCVPWQDHVW